MELFATDREGRKYEVTVDTDKVECNSFTGGSDVEYVHCVTVKGAVGDFQMFSTDETDPQDFLDRVFNRAHEKIDNWLEGK